MLMINTELNIKPEKTWESSYWIIFVFDAYMSCIVRHSPKCLSEYMTACMWIHILNLRKVMVSYDIVSGTAFVVLFISCVI